MDLERAFYYDIKIASGGTRDGFLDGYTGSGFAVIGMGSEPSGLGGLGGLSGPGGTGGR
jgi:hypothetical protein